MMLSTIIVYAAKIVLVGVIVALLIVRLRNEYLRDRFLGVGLSIIAIILLIYLAFFTVIYEIWVD